MAKLAFVGPSEEFIYIENEHFTEHLGLRYVSQVAPSLIYESH